MCGVTHPIFKGSILALLLTTMLGCSSNENETTKSTQVTISNLVGLWNSSEKQGAKTVVMYTRISSTGDIIEYDFDGDEVDKGLNCYHINSGKIIPIKNNIFTITTDMHKGQTFEVELELLDAGHALKIVFLKELVSKNRTASKDGLDAADVDVGKRQVESISSQIWTRMRNSSVLQNEPSCS
jgi:hypothetical protein